MSRVKNDIVKIQASFNPHKDIIKIDGEGQSQLILTSDATQLAKVLTSFAMYKDRLIEVTFRPLSKDLRNAGRKKTSKTYR